MRIGRRRRATKKERLYVLGEYVKYWYRTYKESRHALTTRQVQWSYINVHIVPSFIGGKFLYTVTTADIQEFFNELLDHGNKGVLINHQTKGNPLSTWTVQKIRMLLISMYNQAIKDGICSKNPAKDTEPISVKTLKIEPFTKEQQKLFLDATKKRRFYVAYLLLFMSGMRRSEVLGLSWQYVDFQNSVIHVRQVLLVVNREIVLKNYPKTKSSIRTIPIPKDIMKDLKRIRERQMQESKNPCYSNRYNLVFANKDGSPHSPDNFLKNFKNTIKSLGLPAYLRVHSTRHTFATNLLQQGTSITDVQSLGGWASPKILLEIYAHVVKESQRKAVEKLYKNNSN